MISRRGHLDSHGHHLNELGRCLLDGALYIIQRLYAELCQTRRFFSCVLCISLCKHVTPRRGHFGIRMIILTNFEKQIYLVMLHITYQGSRPSGFTQSNKVAKIRNRYNQVPHLTQDTNGKVTNSQKTPQTRAKRSALSQQVTTKHI